MHFTSPATILAFAVAATGVVAAPFEYPLPDGFPTPTPAQIAAIEQLAGGTLPNGPTPANLTATAITNLHLLALNEFFETAYFTELLANVTNDVPGYDAASIAPLEKTYLVDALTAVVNVSSIAPNASVRLSAPLRFTEPGP